MADEQVVEVKPEARMFKMPEVTSFEGSDKPPVPIPPTNGVDKPTPTIEPPKPAATTDAPATSTQTDDTEIVDANEFLTKETGWNTWEEAKAARAELEELRKQPKSAPVLSAEERDKLFETAYPVIEAKKKLERAEKLDVTKPKDAAEVIKLELALKNRDLDADEVDFIFNDKYNVPNKPQRTSDQLDDEYAETVAQWEKRVEMINKRMVIDAKLAKPELSKLKSEFAYPDIPKDVPAQPEGPTQEALDAQKAVRDSYLQQVESNFSKFSGFNTKIQDEGAEKPVSYQIHDDEKAAVKQLMQTMNVDEYFGTRWFDEKGNAKVERMMADLYFLENSQKVLDGIAEKAASAKFKELVKATSNINLKTGTSNQTNLKPENSDPKYKQEAAIWSA